MGVSGVLLWSVHILYERATRVNRRGGGRIGITKTRWE